MSTITKSVNGVTKSTLMMLTSLTWPFQSFKKSTCLLSILSGQKRTKIMKELIGRLCKVKSHTTIPKRKNCIYICSFSFFSQFTNNQNPPYNGILSVSPLIWWALASLSLECLLYLPCPTQQKGHKSKSHTSPKCHYPQRHLCWVQPCFCITKTTKFKLSTPSKP